MSLRGILPADRGSPLGPAPRPLYGFWSFSPISTRIMSTKLISVMTPCYNEEANVRELYQRIKAVFDALPAYRYEHIFIDNASKDGTVAVLRELAAADPNVKVIVNVRNFGHIRSPYYALLQARGDGVITMASDLQDPPELIPRFLEHWESGRKVVMGVKESSDESLLMYSAAGGLLPSPGSDCGHPDRAAGDRVRAVRPGGDRAAPGARRSLPVLSRADGGAGL